MPYEWARPPDAHGAELHAWPYRSLPRRDFVLFVGATAALVALPLLVLLGSPVMWGLLPFFLAMLAGLWWALQRSQRDGETIETLTIARDAMRLVRLEPRLRRRLEWEADPHWVRLGLDPAGGPVEQYLTLSGGGRKVELGAFLTPPERVELARELSDALTAVRGAPGARG
ncbi:MAG: DUF2244 domain-containing protein [Paracoccaceae bacterium]